MTLKNYNYLEKYMKFRRMTGNKKLRRIKKIKDHVNINIDKSYKKGHNMLHV